MAVHTASLRLTAAGRRALGAPVALGATVLAAAAVNLLVALQRATPRYVPDEYLYPQLARSLARGDGVAVLGEPTRLPALVEPLVTAPVWLAADPELAFRATQAIHAVAMSLAALPVYAIARRLRLRPLATALAVLVTVLSPGFLYVGYTTADALGYTLGLTAIAAGLEALARPRLAAQAGFLAAAAVAAGTRVQYAVVVPAVVAAGLILGPGSVRQRVSRLAVVNGVVALGLVAVVLSGGGLLGRYGDVASFRVTGAATGWAARSLFLLALAAGATLVPGAVAWLGSARRTTLERRAFARLLVALLLLLVLAASVISVETGSERFFERYLLVGLPLLALAFCCWLEDGRPGRRLAVATALGLVVVLTRVPLSTFSAGQGAVDSPLLLAVRRLETVLGVGGASLAVAAVASVALAVGAWSAFGGERRAFVATALTTTAALVAISAGARLEDLALSRQVAAEALGSPAGWADATGARDVLLLQTAASPPARAMDQVLWNASVTEGALLGDDAEPMDGASDRVAVRADGSLSLGERALSRPLLVATWGTRPLWAGASVEARAPGFELVRPSGGATLAALAGGVSSDGWLAGRGTVTVWPGHTVRLRLRVPSGRPATTITVAGRPHLLAPGRTLVLHLSAAGRPHGYAFSSTRSFALDDARFVSARASIGLVNRP